jgi:hypothetical protein
MESMASIIDEIQMLRHDRDSSLNTSPLEYQEIPSASHWSLGNGAFNWLAGELLLPWEAGVPIAGGGGGVYTGYQYS